MSLKPNLVGSSVRNFTDLPTTSSGTDKQDKPVPKPTSVADPQEPLIDQLVLEGALLNNDDDEVTGILFDGHGKLKPVLEPTLSFRLENNSESAVDEKAVDSEESKPVEAVEAKEAKEEAEPSIEADAVSLVTDSADETVIHADAKHDDQVDDKTPQKTAIDNKPETEVGSKQESTETIPKLEDMIDGALADLDAEEKIYGYQKEAPTLPPTPPETPKPKVLSLVGSYTSAHLNDKFNDPEPPLHIQALDSAFVAPAAARGSQIAAGSHTRDNVGTSGLLAPIRPHLASGDLYQNSPVTESDTASVNKNYLQALSKTLSYQSVKSTEPDRDELEQEGALLGGEYDQNVEMEGTVDKVLEKVESVQVGKEQSIEDIIDEVNREVEDEKMHELAPLTPRKIPAIKTKLRPEPDGEGVPPKSPLEKIADEILRSPQVKALELETEEKESGEIEEAKEVGNEAEENDSEEKGPEEPKESEEAKEKLEDVSEELKLKEHEVSEREPEKIEESPSIIEASEEKEVAPHVKETVEADSTKAVESDSEPKTDDVAAASESNVESASETKAEAPSSKTAVESSHPSKTSEIDELLDGQNLNADEIRELEQLLDNDVLTVTRSFQTSGKALKTGNREAPLEKTPSATLLPQPESKRDENDFNEDIRQQIINDLKNEPVYIYTSLASGAYHMIPRTNRLSTILTVNKVPFTFRDLGTDSKARKVWKRYANGRELPAVVRGKDDIIGDWKQMDDYAENYEVRKKIYEEY